MPPDPRPTSVAIALVADRGRWLVGVRPDTSPLPGLAEFPGGKCLPDEPPAECAVRECREETGLAVTPVELLEHRVHTYEHGTLDLWFWLCRREDDREPMGRFRWVPTAELAKCRFPEANSDLIERIVREEIAGE